MEILLIHTFQIPLQKIQETIINNMHIYSQGHVTVANVNQATLKIFQEHLHLMMIICIKLQCSLLKTVEMVHSTNISTQTNKATNKLYSDLIIIIFPPFDHRDMTCYRICNLLYNVIIYTGLICMAVFLSYPLSEASVLEPGLTELNFHPLHIINIDTVVKCLLTHACYILTFSYPVTFL